MPSPLQSRLPGLQERLEATPELLAIITSIEDNVDTFGRDEGFWKCGVLFEQILSGNHVAALINHELRRMTAEPHYGPAASAAFQFTIYVSDSVTLNLLAFEPGSVRRERLQSLTRNWMLGVLGPSDLQVGLYSQSDIADVSILEKSHRLRPATTRMLKCGEILKLRNGEFVADLCPQGLTYALSFVTSPLQDIMWEYDRATLSAIRAVSDSLPSSRIEYALRIIAEVGNADCIPTLMDIADHPAHFIRWAVVKNVARLDPEQGLELLRKSMNDPHPHVRSAAAKSLARIDQESRIY